MFTNDHVRELQPAEWQTRPLGQGTYGLVYKSTWRGQEVAVKVLKLPDLPDDATDAARGALREQVEVIAQDFVTEVDVAISTTNWCGCWVDRPRLMIMGTVCEFHGQTAVCGAGADTRPGVAGGLRCGARNGVLAHNVQVWRQQSQPADHPSRLEESKPASQHARRRVKGCSSRSLILACLATRRSVR